MALHERQQFFKDFRSKRSVATAIIRCDAMKVEDRDDACFAKAVDAPAEPRAVPRAGEHCDFGRIAEHAFSSSQHTMTLFRAIFSGDSKLEGLTSAQAGTLSKKPAVMVPCPLHCLWYVRQR